MDSFEISIGKSRNDLNWKTRWFSWDDFVERLQDVRKSDIKAAKYHAMTRDQKQNIKDGEAFVGGSLSGRRTKENIQFRTMVTLDVDFADDDFEFMCDLAIGGTASALYSTHSHLPDKPKYRLIIPADRAMEPDEYAAVSRKVADAIGITYFDKTTFDVNRLMYFPSAPVDVDPIIEIVDGVPLCVDEWLDQYEDWRDPIAWPRHPDDKKVRHSSGTKKKDPREIPGIIGYFSQAYDIVEAIEELIPEEYEATDSNDRYTYKEASSYGGLIIYDDYDFPSFAFSHHESDPISGMEVGAWDLVRIHLYGHMDDGYEDKPPTERPSHNEMNLFARSLDKVKEYIQDDASGSWLMPFDALPPDTRLPFGFQEIKGKLFAVKETKNDVKYEPVCERKIAITGRFVNVTDNTQQVEISWESERGTTSYTVARSMASDSKKIIALADYGMPVHSGNARALAEYLSRFESENDNILPSAYTSNQMGWMKKGFLIGDDFIGDNDIRFEGMDAGDNAIANGFSPQGSASESFKLLDHIKSYRAVKSAVYASLAAPMLHLLGMPSFIFELAGETSHGKTIAMTIAASLYGSPDPDRPGAIMKTWDATRVFLERLPATLQHLPVFVDDTKKAKDARTISAVVYGFSSGQGRGRGSIKGSQIMLGWNTIMLSSGEQKITTIGREQHGGAEARVLCIDEAPFGSKTDYDSANFVEMLRSTATENYGHVARPWIKFLAGLNRKELKERLAVAAARYKKAAGDNGVVLRLASLMAVLDLAGQLFDECFYTDMYDEKEMMDLWNSVVKGNVMSDQSEVALNVIRDWVVSEINCFSPDIMTHGKTYGRLNASELAILPDVLMTYLRDKGFMNPQGLIKKWAANGVLICDKGRHTKRVRINSARGYCVVFDSRKIGLDIDETNGVFEE